MGNQKKPQRRDVSKKKRSASTGDLNKVLWAAGIVGVALVALIVQQSLIQKAKIPDSYETSEPEPVNPLDVEHIGPEVIKRIPRLLCK